MSTSSLAKDISYKNSQVISWAKQSAFIYLGFVTAGFAFLFAELILMGHYQEGSQLIAVVVTGVGFVLSLLGFVPKTLLRQVVMVLFLLLTLSGVYGTLEHREGRGERIVEADTALKATTDEVAQEALQRFGSNPPILSPLALSGLALLGGLTVWGMNRTNTDDIT